MKTASQDHKNQTESALTPYNLTIATTNCQIWDQEKKLWKSDKGKCSV